MSNGTTLYTDGTGDFTNGSPNVTGHSTLWTNLVNGDTILAPDGKWYELTITDDTHIVLDRNYGGSTVTTQPYTIFKNSTSRDSIRTSSKQLSAISATYGALISATGPSQTLKLNKSTTADSAGMTLRHFTDASDTFQVGSFDDDAFSIKYQLASSWTKAFGVDQSSGAVSLFSQLLIGGVIAPTQITANTPDYAPTGLAQASILMLSTDATRQLSGLTGGAAGRLIAIINTGANQITISNEGTASAAINRFRMSDDLLMQTNTAALFIYDATSSRWRSVSNTCVPAQIAFVSSGDSYNRFTIDGNGTMLWGSGANPLDSLLQRLGINTIYTQGQFEIGGNQLTIEGSNPTIGIPAASGALNVIGGSSQQLSLFDGIAISSGTYNSSTGVVTLTLASSCGIIHGITFNVVGALGTGVDCPSLNGSWAAGVGTTGTTLIYTIATGLTISTITGGTISAPTFLNLGMTSAGRAQISSFNNVSPYIGPLDLNPTGGLVTVGAGGLSITPTAQSTVTALNVVQSGPVAGSTSALINYNNIKITGDDYNAAAQGANALNIDFGFGGSNFQGQRSGINVYAHLDNTGSSSNSSPFYSAGSFLLEAWNPDTSTSALVGLQQFTVLQAGATGYHSITGLELNASIVASASAAYRAGANVVSAGANQGTSGDFGIVIGAMAGSPGWRAGVAFTRFNGIPSMATTGTLFATDANVETIANVMDFHLWNVTNYIFNFQNFTVTGAGAATATSYKVGSNQVVGARATGYAAMTGSVDRADVFATTTVTLAQLAARVAALQADLTAHGLIGA